MSSVDRHGDPLATARWADPAYISDKYYFEPGDIWVGRNPHNFDSAVGVKPNEHVFMCASTGSGKGRSVITNNILLWPGSLVVYDPKGDLPAVCAPGRGQGDDHATNPMGQKVIVLDPLGHSKSDPSYLGYYDPVTSLDRDDPGFRGMCSFLAQALIKVPDDSNHAEWAKMGRDLLSTIIEHVVSTPDYDDRPEERNLFTVLNLLKKGRRDLQIQYCNELVERGELDKKDLNKRLEDLGDPYVLLFDEIAENPHNSYIRDDGDRWRQSYLRTAKTFTSIRDEAVRGLDWITKDVGMETALVGTRHGSPILPSSQRFDPRELKQNPDGVSLFIVLPSDQMETYGAWVQAVFMGIFASMRRTSAHPDLAHPTLGIIDEFSSLGKQDYIANALDTIRDEGMRLMIVVQQFGWMQDVYGKRTETFLSNAGLKLFFGDPGETATDYLVKLLGETEIIKYATTRNSSHARMEGTNQSNATNSSRSIAEGETRTEQYGSSDTIGESTADAYGTSHAEQRSQSTSRSKQWNWNNSTNWSNGRNWGEGTGSSMGRNYGPHVFWEGLEHSTSYGSTSNRSSGGSHNRGGANARGGGGSTTKQSTKGTTDTVSQTKTNTQSSSYTRNQSTSQARTFTQTHTTGEVHTEGTNESDTYTSGESVAEGFHKKPLMEHHEFRKYLSALPEDEHDHPAYPGLMLAIIGKEDPVLLRRSNYDQDRYFEGLFSKHPKFEFLPYDQQPVLGYELGPESILSFYVPDALQRIVPNVEVLQRKLARFAIDDDLFRVSGPIEGNNRRFKMKAKLPGRVLNNDKGAQSGFVTLRYFTRSTPLLEGERAQGAFRPFLNEQLRLDELAEQERLVEEERRRQAKERAEDIARRRARNRRISEAREAEQKKQQVAIEAWSRFFQKRDDLVHYEKSVNQFQWLTGVGIALGLAIHLAFLVGFLGLIAFIGGIAMNIAAGERLCDEQIKLRQEFKKKCEMYGRPEDYPELSSVIPMPQPVAGKLTMFEVFEKYVLKK